MPRSSPRCAVARQGEGEGWEDAWCVPRLAKLYPQNWTLVKVGVPISQTLEKGASPW